VATDADGVRQPITSGLEVSAGPGSGLSVFFGTGTYFKEGDHSSTAGQQVQSLYSIWDNGERITGDREDALQEQLITSQDATSPSVRRTTTNTVNYLTQRGWYLDLRVGTQASAAVGERFIGTPRLQNGKVFFTTYVPQGDSCTPGGKNWLYSLDAVTGAAAMSQISLDASGDPPVCSGADCGGISLSEGAPVRDTSVLLPTPNPAPGLSGGCVPGTAGCEPPNDPDDVYQRCAIVIRASGAPPLYLPRPCGRQSWRQIR
jgi:type IV pilus assembly protein PilY1